MLFANAAYCFGHSEFAIFMLIDKYGNVITLVTPLFLNPGSDLLGISEHINAFSY